MSSRLYATRLWWHGAGGGAKLHGFEVRLIEAPRINEQVIKSIDYVPEIRLQSVQFFGEPQREMTREEVLQADMILRRLCAPDSEW